MLTHFQKLHPFITFQSIRSWFAIPSYQKTGTRQRGECRTLILLLLFVWQLTKVNKTSWWKILAVPSVKYSQYCKWTVGQMRLLPRAGGLTRSQPEPVRWAPEWAEGGTPDSPFLSPLLCDASSCTSQSTHTCTVCMVCTPSPAHKLEPERATSLSSLFLSCCQLSVNSFLPSCSIMPVVFYSIPNKGSTSPLFALQLVTSDEIPAHCSPVLHGSEQCLHSLFLTV